MTYIAEGITCDAPGARICGARLYQEFLGGFMAQLTGVQTVAAFGDDSTAVLVYYPHTARVSDAPTAKCFTVPAGESPAACSSLTGHRSPRRRSDRGTVPGRHSEAARSRPALNGEAGDAS